MADLVYPIPHLRVQSHGRFHSGLGVELGWEADLKQNIFHHVTAVVPLEAELRCSSGAISARRTAWLVASPAAQLLREPALGA